MATKQGPCCYFKSSFEDKLHVKFKDYEPQELAWLIGYYNDHHNEDEQINRDDESDANIIDTVNKLIKFQRADAIRALSKQLRNTQTNLSEAYGKIAKDFTTEEFYDSMRLISDLFSLVAKEEYANLSEGISCTKEDFIKGFVHNGVAYGGEAYLFHQTFQYLINNIINAGQVEGPAADLAMRCLDNFPALCVFARRDVMSTEGLSSVLNDFAERVEGDFYQAEDIEYSLSIEETKPEHWMEQSDSRNPKASFTAAVKLCLRTMPDYKYEKDEETGEYDYVMQEDSFGRPKYRNEDVVYRELKKICSGCTTADAMLQAIENSSLPYAEDLLEKLNSDAQLKTSLFVAIRKNNQLYALFKDSVKNGIHSFSTVLANGIVNPLTNAFKNGVFTILPTRLQSTKPGASSRYLFQDNKMQEEQRQRLLVFAQYLPKRARGKVQQAQTQTQAASQKSTQGEANIFDEVQTVKNLDRWRSLPNFKTNATQPISKYDVINEILITLQIEEVMKSMKINTEQVIDHLLSNPKDLAKFMDAFADVLLFIDQKTNTTIPLTSLFTPNDNGTTSAYAVAIDKILGLIGEISGTTFRKQSTKYFNTKGDTITMFSDVVPFSMADKIEKLQAFVQNDDAEGFLTYIKTEFQSNPLFYDETKPTEKEKWLNYWMYELVNSVGHKRVIDPHTYKFKDKIVFKDDSFAKKFNYRRMLGQTKANNGKPFEDFAAQTHAIQMMTSFFSEKKKGMTVYPVFTLADSMIEREITAPVYSINSNKILRPNETNLHDLLWKVYQSELNRQEQVKLFNKWCDENNLERIENYSNTENTFSYLTFLNGKSKDSLPKTKEDFFKALDEHMQKTIGNVNDPVTASYDGKPTVFASLNAMGVLERKTNEDGTQGSYVFLRDFAKQKSGSTETQAEALQRNVELWYWNTFYANIQQFQMFTADVAFYKDTKDFQKRYKELSAAGTVLDLDATWDGKPVFVDKAGNRDVSEKCIYFQDINVNAENTNPEFMKCILYTYASDDKKVDAFINKYKESEDDWIEENGKDSVKERNEALKELLGDEGYERYKEYQKNTLTDGQGYRSLSSYRKIAIASGEWTDLHEKWYNKIKQLQNVAQKRNLTQAEYETLNEGCTVILQPLKPYYFGMEYKSLTLQDGTKFNAAVPVQHKYAEVVLIPQLLPEGSKLREMAEFMENNDIDMICSTKCVKVGNFAAVSINDLQEGETLTDRLNAHVMQPNSIHVLSMENYRIQTNVPEHMDVNQLFGTQIRKLIMANIDINTQNKYLHYVPNGEIVMQKGKKAVPLTGTNLIRFYNSLIVANILEDFRKFDIATDTIRKVSQVLQKAVINNDREVIEHVMDYAITKDGERTLIPLLDPFLSHDAVAQIASIYKKQVNKQRIKGGAAVQASAFGLNKMVAESASKKDQDKANSGDLKIRTSEDGKNLLYMECEMPFMLKIGGQDLKFDDYCNEDGTLKMSEDGKTSKIEKEFPGILDIVAYRIPTEKHYSMLNMKVVRFSRPEAGGTLKVPAQCTTIAGFDFDIDKLYFFRKEFRVKDVQYHHPKLTSPELFKIWSDFYDDHQDIMLQLEQYAIDTKDYTVDKKGNRHFNHPINYYWDKAGIEIDKQEAILPYIEDFCQKNDIDLNEVTVTRTFDDYDYNKAPIANSKAGRNNALLNIIQQRLQDPETLKSRITPGGFKNPKNAARIMARLMDPSVTTANLNLDDLKAKAAEDKIIQEPNYNPCDPITNILYTQQNQIAGKLIGVFANQSTNHAFCTVLEECKIKKPVEFLGNKFDDLVSAPTDKNGKKRDVDLYVAEYLAASVDAVKDPVLKFLNFNTLNADTGATMARLGYNTYEIGLLFSQPIMREIWDYAANHKCNIKTASLAIEKQWAAKLNKNIVDAEKEAAGNEIIQAVQSEKTLVNNILLYKENPKNSNATFVKQQIAMLQTFNKFQKISQDVTELVRITKFTAANSVKSTMGGLYSQQMSAAKAIDKYVKSLQAKDEKTNKKVDEEHQLSFTIKLNPYLQDTLKNGMPLDNNPKLLTMSDEEYMNYIMENPFAFEQAMFDQARKLLQRLEQYFPYNAPIFANARNMLNTLYKYGTPSEKVIEKLHSHIITQVLKRDGNGSFKPTADCLIKLKGSTLQSNQEFYNDPNVIHSLYLALVENLSTDFVIQMKEITDENEKKHLVKSIDASRIIGATTEEKEKFIFDWIQLSNNTNPITSDFVIKSTNGDRPITGAELADMLFFYYFYKSGMMFNPTGVLSLTPSSVKQDLIVKDDGSEFLTYPDFLNSLSDSNNSTYTEPSIGQTNKLLFEFIASNPEDYNLVYNVITDTKEKSLYRCLKEDIANAQFERIVIDLTAEKYKDYLPLLTKSEGDKKYFLPAFKLDGKLYICEPVKNGALNEINEAGRIAVVEYKENQEFAGEVTQTNLTSGENQQEPTEDTEESGENPEELSQEDSPAATQLNNLDAEEAWELLKNLIITAYEPMVRAISQETGQSQDVEYIAKLMFTHNFDSIKDAIHGISQSQIDAIKADIANAFTPGSPIKGALVFSEEEGKKGVPVNIRLCC